MTPTKPTTPIGFDDSADSAADWFRAHGRKVGLGALIAIALAAVLYFVRSSNEAKEMAAARALVGAQRSVGSGNLPLAAADLQKLADTYGGTRAGKEGRILLAQVQLQQGKVDSALRTLDAVGDAGVLQASVHALRGAALEQSGKPAEAAAEYLRASETSQLEGEGESFKADAARAYLAAGRRDDAIRVWEGIAANASSVLYNEAQLRLGELTATTIKE
jgi:predicted negative regulator of RcsB-dependent stress response